MARFGLEPQQIGIRLRRLFERTVVCNVAGLDTDFNAKYRDEWTTVYATHGAGTHASSSITVIRSEDFESAFYNLTEISVDPNQSAEEIVDSMPKVVTQAYVAGAVRSAVLHSPAASQIIESSVRQELLVSRFRFNADTRLVEIRTATNMGDALHHMRFELDKCLVERKLDESICAGLIQNDWENHYV